MPSHDVSLPFDHVPTFPSRCVVCLRDNPDDLYIVSRRGLHWRMLLVHVLPGRRIEAEAPCCRDCRVQLTQSRRVRGIADWVVAVVAAGLVFWWYRNRDAHMPKWALVAAIVVALIPSVVLEVLRPLPFDITPGLRNVSYDFADHAYAVEFAQLNGTKVD